MKTKFCRTCKLDLPLSDFTTTEQSRGQYTGACKSCESLRVVRIRWRRLTVDQLQKEIDKEEYRLGLKKEYLEARIRNG